MRNVQNSLIDESNDIKVIQEKSISKIIGAKPKFENPRELTSPTFIDEVTDFDDGVSVGQIEPV